ncbi:MAG: nucleotide pyrophosphohydrolase [Candidatus Izemoplasmatales bacterium]
MKEIIKKLLKFRNERDWEQFHTPENLSKSIVIEAAELLENFQWNNECKNTENIKEELADIMIYCLLLCEKMDFNVEKVINDKINLNNLKYPVNKAKGNAKKYSEL